MSKRQKVNPNEETQSKRQKMNPTEKKLWEAHDPENPDDYAFACLKIDDSDVFKRLRLLPVLERAILVDLYAKYYKLEKICFSKFLETLSSCYKRFDENDEKYKILIAVLCLRFPKLGSSKLLKFLDFFEVNDIFTNLESVNWTADREEQELKLMLFRCRLNPVSRSSGEYLDLFSSDMDKQIILMKLLKNCPKYFVAFYNEYLDRRGSINVLIGFLI